MDVGIFGTGNVARRLGALAHKAGHRVLLGSRGAGAAAPATIEGLPIGSLPDTATFGEVVVLAVPYTACADVLPPVADRLRGTVVVDATNPLNADWSPLDLPQGRPAAEHIAALVPGATVVKAFNTVFADTMTAAGLVRHGASVTTFIAGDDPAACRLVATFAETLGFHARLAGPLRHATYLEGLAHLNIHVATALGAGTDVALVYSESSKPHMPATSQDRPSMAAWERAWADGDAAAVAACYADDALLMHPTKAAVFSRAEIERFLAGGVGRLHVGFTPSAVVGRDSPRLEYGRFADRDASGADVATGTYAVAWVRERGRWLIQFHGWNSPA